ncbi:hypothetical protein AOLI_G00240760 [Acnodon oligacanthus]
MNRTVKERLTKAMMETGQKWLDLLPAILYKPTHSFVPGDTVLVKILNPRKAGEAVYGPPTNVIIVMRTAVLTTSSPQRIHASQPKKSSIPEMPKTRD